MKQVNTVKVESLHVQHVLLAIKQLSLVQPIATSVDLVNIFLSKYFYLNNNQIIFIGHYCPHADEAPIQCPPGFAQINPGQVVCDKCPAGSYADKAAMAKCIPCPPGMFCPENRNSPLPCPTNRLASQAECHLETSIG